MDFSILLFSIPFLGPEFIFWLFGNWPDLGVIVHGLVVCQIIGVLIMLANRGITDKDLARQVESF